MPTHKKWKRTLGLSSVSQVLCKYLDDKNEIHLPAILEADKDTGKETTPSND